MEGLDLKITGNRKKLCHSRSYEEWFRETIPGSKGDEMRLECCENGLVTDR
jgi:hypothetical protein